LRSPVSAKLAGLFLADYGSFVKRAVTNLDTAGASSILMKRITILCQIIRRRR
jgi:hypothetical protein